jgi:hypothetical protein
MLVEGGSGAVVSIGTSNANRIPPHTSCEIQPLVGSLDIQIQKDLGSYYNSEGDAPGSWRRRWSG